MAKTRPGLDRIQKRMLQVDYDRAMDALAVHENQCPQCNEGTRSVYNRCAYWWEHAKRAHKAKRKLRKYQVPEHGDVNMLPGMENL